MFYLVFYADKSVRDDACLSDHDEWHEWGTASCHCLPRYNRIVPDADGFHFLRAVPVQVFRYFDKRVPYCGWHYHLHDRFRHVAGTLCESQAERGGGEDICERHFHYAPCHPDALRAGCDRQCLDADGRCRDIGKEVHLDRDDRIDLFYHLPDPPRFHTSEPLHRRDGQ